MQANTEITLDKLSSESHIIKYIADELTREFPESTRHRIEHAITIARRSEVREWTDFFTVCRRYLLGPAQ
jgi:hypothetical protein